MENRKWVNILNTLALIGLGLVLLLYPGDTVLTIVRIVGIGLLVVGAVSALVWLLQKEERSYPGKLLLAVLEILAAIVILAKPTIVLSIYPVVIGLLIALEGVANLIAAVDMKQAGMSRATLGIILSLVTIVLGVLIVLNPFTTLSTLVRVMGFVMIYSGVSGLLITLFRK